VSRGLVAAIGGRTRLLRGWTSGGVSDRTPGLPDGPTTRTVDASPTYRLQTIRRSTSPGIRSSRWTLGFAPRDEADPWNLIEVTVPGRSFLTIDMDGTFTFEQIEGLKIREP
jgi:hypothetical protein